jgi:hypothetical protein
MVCLPVGAGGDSTEGVGGKEDSAYISASLTSIIWLARSSPVEVREQEGEGEGLENIVRKTLMVV